MKEQPLNGIFNRELAELISQKHQISVLHIGFSDVAKIALDSKTVSDNFEEHVVSIPQKGSAWLRQFRYFRAFFQVACKIRKASNKPDVIHVQVAWKMGLPGWILKIIWNLPLVITEHYTGYLKADGSLKGYKKWWSYFLLHRANRVTAVSESLSEVFRSHHVRGVETIHNSIHNLFFENPIQEKPPGNPYTFIHISNFNRQQKQTNIICDTFLKLREQHSNCKLVLIVPEDGYHLYLAEKGAATLDGIEFHKPIESRQEFISILKQADILVSYSRFETFGLTVAEALCCGIPVIYTRCGGPEYFVEPRMGLLADAANSNSLYHAMETAMQTHPFQASDIAEAARSIFSEEEILLRYCKLYSQLTYG